MPDPAPPACNQDCHEWMPGKGTHGPNCAVTKAGPPAPLDELERLWNTAKDAATRARADRFELNLQSARSAEYFRAKVADAFPSLLAAIRAAEELAKALKHQSKMQAVYVCILNEETVDDNALATATGDVVLADELVETALAAFNATRGTKA